MKKLFISLPMAGKSEDEIRNKMAEYKENWVNLQKFSGIPQFES